MEDIDTFIQLPLHLDPSTKALSCPSLPNDASLQRHLSLLNTTHRTLLGLDTTTQIPAPPTNLDPTRKRSSQITKLRDSANTSYKKAAYPDALRLYTFAIEMAATRPAWEPAGLVREELAGLYSNRAQTHMAMGSWVEGRSDAEASVECKRQLNAKAWWRGGRCLVEMGRWEEAREWVGMGLEVETAPQPAAGQGQTDKGEGKKELEGLMGEIRKALERQNN